MSNLESPQSFVFLYEENSQQKHALVYAANLKEAYVMFHRAITESITEKTGREPKIINVYHELPREEDPWERNVQHLRVEFPPLQDEKQDEEVLVLAKMIEEYMKQRYMGMGYKTNGVVSLGGFYRGDHNWDNVDEPDACVNHPNRGSGENEP